MSHDSPTVAVAAAPSVPGARAGALFLPAILCLFLGSGCAALIYEIVWFQLLEFTIGSSAISIGVLLATFMGGLCLGSLLLPRMVSARLHPLRVYACLELGIGLLGVLMTLALPALEGVYAAIGSPSILLRAVLSALILLPPTLLMGATLPAISRWVESTPRGLAWLGFFYGGNTLGAVAGCLLAGFYLLRNFDMATASYFAAGINFAVAAAAFALARSGGGTVVARAPAAPESPAIFDPGLARLSDIHIYLTIGLSGMAALGAQVIWTRLLSLLLGATTYTFSIILAVFLLGLGIGSSFGAMITRAGKNPRLALAVSQILCSVGIAWTAWAVTNGIPNWPVDPPFALEAQHLFALDLARTAWAILPATLCWGAAFPLALAAVVRPTGDSAQAVGRVYAANTVGAIAGALFFSLIAVSAWGSQGSQRVLIGLAAVAGVLAALSPLWESAAGGRVQAASLARAVAALVAAICVGASTIGILAAYQLDALPWQLVAYGRNVLNDRQQFSNRTLVVLREGQTSSVAVTQARLDERYFHVAGKVEASTLPEDMRLQLMLGHFPALFHPDPKKVLIVGCGAGVTAGTFILHLPQQDPKRRDDVKLVICEIEPMVPQVVATYFKEQNNGVLTTNPSTGKFIDERVHVEYDDARHYILTTDEKFDIITSDPIHPWVKGAASLYTKEYFDLVKKHLKPGGLVTQWVPLYESSPEVVKSEVRTFFEAFPYGSIWSNDRAGEGYDVILLGSDQPIIIDVPALKNRLDNRVIKKAMSIGLFENTGDILRTYAGSADDVRDWMSTGEVNRDANLRLQYLAGAALNNNLASRILHDMMRRRTFPETFLNLTPDQRADLTQSWAPFSPRVSATAPASQPGEP